MLKTNNANLQWGDLEEFVNVGAKISKPVITINPNSTITLNAGFIHLAKTQISDNEYVHLSYSKKNKAIVFEFTKDSKREGAIKMTKQINIAISARSFFNYYLIDINTVKGKYEPELITIPKKGERWVLFFSKKKR